MLTSPSIKKVHQVDPRDFLEHLPGLSLKKAVTYQTATGSLGKVPPNSLITTVEIARTTPWTAITAFEVGKSGDTDWLVETAQANVNGAIPSGEGGAVEVIEVHKFVTSETEILLTLNQGAASAGAGFVKVNFEEFSPS